MNNKEQNTQWLTEYQPDLLKICGKFVKAGHKLSVEEVVSDINNHFLTKLIDKKFENKLEFKKFAYKVARNFINWTAKGSVHKDRLYNANRIDYTVFDDEEGEQTTFDLLCKTIGEEDPNFEKLNASEKYENVMKWLLDYSDILTPRQKNLLPFVLKGKKIDELGDIIGVTHQAISYNILDMYERIKSHIKININDDCDATTINKGNQSIKYLFGGERKKLRSKKV